MMIYTISRWHTPLASLYPEGFVRIRPGFVGPISTLLPFWLNAAAAYWLMNKLAPLFIELHYNGEIGDNPNESRAMLFFFPPPFAEPHINYTRQRWWWLARSNKISPPFKLNDAAHDRLRHSISLCTLYPLFSYLVVHDLLCVCYNILDSGEKTMGTACVFFSRLYVSLLTGLVQRSVPSIGCNGLLTSIKAALDFDTLAKDLVQEGMNRVISSPKTFGLSEFICIHYSTRTDYLDYHCWTGGMLFWLNVNISKHCVKLRKR